MATTVVAVQPAEPAQMGAPGSFTGGGGVVSEASDAVLTGDIDKVKKIGRTTKHKGGIARENDDYIKVNYSAEVWDPPFKTRMELFCTKCTWVDKPRTYLYIRENSIEHNLAYKQCFGFFKSQDYITVQYFDKPAQFELPPPGPLRTTEQEGSTARVEADKIHVVYDAEIKQVGCLSRVMLAVQCCSIMDLERSYMLVRENSLETNVAYTMCCGKCVPKDSITVDYFDRKPYLARLVMCEKNVGMCAKGLQLHPAGALSAPLWNCGSVCCAPSIPPRLESVDFSHTCCFCPCPNGWCFSCCCLQKQLVLVKYDKICGGMCPNRINSGLWCLGGNCFNCCGPKAGQPIFYYNVFSPQPQDPDEFAKYAQFAMAKDPSRNQT